MIIEKELKHLRYLTEKLNNKEREVDKLNRILRIMIDTIPLMVWMKDENEIYLWANKLVCDRLLYTNIDEVVDKTDIFFEDREKLLSPDNDKWHSFGRACHKSDQIVLKTGEHLHMIEEGYLRGESVKIEIWKSPVFKNGKIIGIVGTGRFIKDEE
jgi:PAS domain-containing protein